MDTSFLSSSYLPWIVIILVLIGILLLRTVTAQGSEVGNARTRRNQLRQQLDESARTRAAAKADAAVSKARLDEEVRSTGASK